MDTSAALGPVVVGVDATTAGNRAVDWASDYASVTGRRLLVVHGTGLPPVRPNAQDLLEAERTVAEAAQWIVDAGVERALERHPDLTVAGVAEVGDPPSVLLEEAKDAALLAVGSRRDESFKRLFGSVSLAITRHATCPLVVVRPQAEGTPSPLHDRVVLGLDGTAASVRAAWFAFEYASLNNLPLVIVHADQERLARGSAVLGLLSSGEERGITEEEELTIAETIAGLPERYPDVEFRESHRSADPAEALVEASESAELVVVGARKMGSAKAILLRSVSTALVEHAHCPVAVVHAGSHRADGSA
ncbi:MAG: universal stress protein [Nocardioidaceae bacterium]